MLARDRDSWRDLSGSLQVSPRRATSDDNDNDDDDHDHDDDDNDALIFHSTSTHQLGI